MQRRNWIFGVTAAVLGMSFLPKATAQVRSIGRGRLRKYPNSHFYNRDGSFNQTVAKEAFAELFRYYNYSIGESVLADKNFWVNDFGLGDFSNVGMGGIFFINDKEHGYFGHEIYLLPGQMIPEHFHVAAEDKPAKHEMWQVRHGSIHTMAQGGTLADLPKGLVLPESQLKDNAITCFKAKACGVADQDILAQLEQPHFMIAGPQGAIVTEYASYHSGDGLRFTNPKAKV
ncbi:MAG: hypothetical protein ACRC46_02475 [Thermoguttaceae bacterium]